MPARKTVTNEGIVRSAMCLLEDKGGSYINARSIAKRAGCSTQPLYCAFVDMGELKRRLIVECKKVFGEYLSREKSDNFFRSFAFAYLHFAKEKPNLFSYVYLENEYKDDGDEEFRKTAIKTIMAKGGYTEEIAERFYYSAWFFVHGIATQLAKGFAYYKEESLMLLLDDQFKALKAYYGGKKSNE